MGTPPAPISPTPVTRVDRFLLWAKNNRVVAGLIIVGLVIGAVSSFTDSARKVIGTVAEIVGAARSPTAEELASRSQVQRAAQLVDTYFARAIGERVYDYRPPTFKEYQQMQSALRLLVITFNAQRQPEQAKNSEMALELLKKLHAPDPIPYGERRSWEPDRLQLQREELNAVFQALEHSPPGGAASSAGATKP